MSDILKMDFVRVYIDDIIIFSKSFEEHLVHLREVFTILLRKKILLNPEKCSIACASVIYLGHGADEKNG